MLEARIKMNINMPNLNFQKDMEHIAERFFIPMLSAGIEQGRDLEGRAFPANEPGTIKRKRRLGRSRPDHPLIDTGELRMAFIAKRHGQTAVLLTLTDNRKEIGGFLQIDGIRSSHGTKFFNFFGISLKMESIALAYMQQRIGEAIRNA